MSDEQGGCPACGAEVKELEDGRGECAGCGLTLVSDESEGERLISALARAVRAKLKTGAELEAALSLSCAELGMRLTRGEESTKACCAAPSSLAAPSPSAGDKVLSVGHEPCPVCGSPEREDEERCAGCGLYFAEGRKMRCSKCGQTSDEAACACGAILTLERLLEYFDASAKAVCPRCRQLYVAPKPKCADCESPLRPVDGLRQAAAG